MDRFAISHSDGSFNVMRETDDLAAAHAQCRDDNRNETREQYLSKVARVSINVIEIIPDPAVKTPASDDLYDALNEIMADPRCKGIDPAMRRKARAALIKAKSENPDAGKGREQEKA